MVLQLSELRDRPELIVTLIPFVRRLKGYTNETLIALATAAVQQAVETTFVLRVVNERCRPILQTQADTLDYDVQVNALRLVTWVNPSRGLQLLRHTRWQRRGSDFDEHGQRREIAALAHERLNRPNLAVKLRSD